jgi:hypothetical protein
MLIRSLAKFRFSALLAAMLVLAFAAAAPVHAAEADADQEENSGFDHDIFKSVLKNMGLYNDGDSIDYRERSPLVVPPGRDLPVPAKPDVAVKNNPAWPVDQDVKRKEAEKKARAAHVRRSASALEEESKPLLPDQLRGPPPSASSTAAQSGRSQDYVNPAREGAPSAGANLWNSMFSKEEQTAPFKGEPPRVSLTEPPAGYQTPSPNFAYGINSKEAPKVDSKQMEISR